MKNLRSIAIAVAASGILSGVAFADNPVVKELTLGGEVTTVAIFPTDPVLNAGDSDVTISGSSITLNELASSELHPAASTFTANYENVTINYSSYVEIQSSKNGLKADGEAPAGFVNRVDYTAKVSIGDIDYAEFTTDGSDGAKLVKSTYKVDPIPNATVSIYVSTVSNDTDQLMEGTYSDTLRLRIGTSL